MLKRFSPKKILFVIILFALPGVLFWLVLEKALDNTVFLAVSVTSLALAFGNLWDAQKQSRKRALEEVDFARELAEKSQYRAALNRLEQALEFDPGCFEVRVARGEVYRLEQSYDKARRELVEAIQIRPDSFRAHFALGLTFLQEKKVFEAISEFRRTLQLKPDFGEAHFILAQAYELAGEKAKALEEYRAFLKAVVDEENTGRKIKEYVERSQSRILALQ